MCGFLGALLIAIFAPLRLVQSLLLKIIDTKKFGGVHVGD